VEVSAPAEAEEVMPQRPLEKQPPERESRGAAAGKKKREKKNSSKCRLLVGYSGRAALR
jgi:hypothetical protein